MEWKNIHFHDLLKGITQSNLISIQSTTEWSYTCSFYNTALGDDKDNLTYMHIIMLFVKTTFTGFFFEVLRYTVNAKPGLPGTLVEVIKKLKITKVRDKK